MWHLLLIYNKGFSVAVAARVAPARVAATKKTAARAPAARMVATRTGAARPCRLWQTVGG